MAMSKYEAALSSNPDNYLALHNWGDALHHQALKKTVRALVMGHTLVFFFYGKSVACGLMGYAGRRA